MAVYHVDTIMDADVTNALLVLCVLSYALLLYYASQNRYISCLKFGALLAKLDKPDDLMYFFYFGTRRYEDCLSCCPSMDFGD